MFTGIIEEKGKIREVKLSGVSGTIKSPHQKFLKEQRSETALQLTAYVLL